MGTVSPLQPSDGMILVIGLNIDRKTVFSARAVLSEGTPDEIAACEAGEAAVSTVAKKIRINSRHSSRAGPKEAGLSRGFGPDRILAYFGL